MSCGHICISILANMLLLLGKRVLHFFFSYAMYRGNPKQGIPSKDCQAVQRNDTRTAYISSKCWVWRPVKYWLSNATSRYNKVACEELWHSREPADYIRVRQDCCNSRLSAEDIGTSSRWCWSWLWVKWKCHQLHQQQVWIQRGEGSKYHPNCR